MENIFYNDAYLKETKTQITDIIEIENKIYLTVKENIFYPQGGGQKGDRGILIVDNKEYLVLNTIKNPQNPYHSALLVIDEPEDVLKSLINKEVTCKLDWLFRYSQMRLHTLLHLFHSLMEQVINKELVYPKISSIKDDNTAFLQYETDDINEEIISKTQELLLKELASDSEVKTYPDNKQEGYRWWEYKSFKIPCGGTHIKNIKEIGDIELSFSTKKGHKTISFILKEVIK